MPSPVAHFSMGAFLWFFLKDHMGAGWQRTRLPRWTLLGLFLLFSILPDFDAVLGILAGDMYRFHNQQSHSIFFGILVSAVLAVGLHALLRVMSFARFPEVSRKKWIFVICLSYQLHLLMDLFTHGRGLRLFWPLTSERVPAPVELFVGLRWSKGIWSSAHWLTLANELLFSLCLFLICLLASRRRSR
ncbi:MAG: metal-dependent hydrolase [Verrucomicrobia bacterium]|nr:metal-dependent hydrolase [Verrucomicrobiota bacterium]MCH8511119.1 metal-dependent hydrolase [Kiritimatiellia bacterium]